MIFLIPKTKEEDHWKIQTSSELEHAAAALAEQKEFAENLVQNSAVPTFVINAERQVIIWNRACEEMTGIKAELMLGKDDAWKGFYNNKRAVLAEVVIDGTLDQASACYPVFRKSSSFQKGWAGRRLV